MVAFARSARKRRAHINAKSTKPAPDGRPRPQGSKKRSPKQNASLKRARAALAMMREQRMVPTSLFPPGEDQGAPSSGTEREEDVSRLRPRPHVEPNRPRGVLHPNFDLKHVTRFLYKRAIAVRLEELCRRMCDEFDLCGKLGEVRKMMAAAIGMSAKYMEQLARENRSDPIAFATKDKPKPHPAQEQVLSEPGVEEFVVALIEKYYKRYGPFATTVKVRDAVSEEFLLHVSVETMRKQLYRWSFKYGPTPEPISERDFSEENIAFTKRMVLGRRARVEELLRVHTRVLVLYHDETWLNQHVWPPLVWLREGWEAPHRKKEMDPRGGNRVNLMSYVVYECTLVDGEVMYTYDGVLRVKGGKERKHARPWRGEETHDMFEIASDPRYPVNHNSTVMFFRYGKGKGKDRSSTYKAHDVNISALNAINIIRKEYPGCPAIVMFDQAGTHKTVLDGAIRLNSTYTYESTKGGNQGNVTYGKEVLRQHGLLADFERELSEARQRAHAAGKGERVSIVTTSKDYIKKHLAGVVKESNKYVLECLFEDMEAQRLAAIKEDKAKHRTPPPPPPPAEKRGRPRRTKRRSTPPPPPPPPAEKRGPPPPPPMAPTAPVADTPRPKWFKSDMSKEHIASTLALIDDHRKLDLVSAAPISMMYLGVGFSRMNPIEMLWAFVKSTWRREALHDLSACRVHVREKMHQACGASCQRSARAWMRMALKAEDEFLQEYAAVDVDVDMFKKVHRV